MAGNKNCQKCIESCKINWKWATIILTQSKIGRRQLFQFLFLVLKVIINDGHFKMDPNKTKSIGSKTASQNQNQQIKSNQRSISRVTKYLSWHGTLEFKTFKCFQNVFKIFLKRFQNIFRTFSKYFKKFSKYF